MAVEMPVFTKAFKAAADLSAKQYYIVKLSGADAVDVCSATTDKPIGVLQNAPASGDTALVMIIGESKVSSDVALAVGNLICTSADGQGAVMTPGTDTTKYTLGQVTVASSNASELASAIINCANIGRGA